MYNIPTQNVCNGKGVTDFPHNLLIQKFVEVAGRDCHLLIHYVAIVTIHWNTEKVNYTHLITYLVPNKLNEKEGENQIFSVKYLLSDCIYFNFMVMTV